MPGQEYEVLTLVKDVFELDTLLSVADITDGVRVAVLAHRTEQEQLNAAEAYGYFGSKFEYRYLDNWRSKALNVQANGGYVVRQMFEKVGNPTPRQVYDRRFNNLQNVA